MPSPAVNLPPDQQAVLSLLVKQDRTYEEIAGLLGLAHEAVRERAHRALAGLAGEAPPDGEVADYVLGQQDARERAAARRRLRSEPEAREWVERATDALDDWDEAPPPPAAPKPAAARSPRPQRQRARRPARVAAPEPRPARRIPAVPRLRRPVRPSTAVAGGALALALAAALVIFGLRGDDEPARAGGDGAAQTQTQAAQPTPVAQALLSAPAGGTARGALVFATAPQGQTMTFLATGLAATTRSRRYVLWIEPRSGEPVALGFLPEVGDDGGAQVQAQLTEAIAAADYTTAFVTRERATSDTGPAPSEPGRRVLSGRLQGV